MAEITIPKEEGTTDIYDYGFDRDLTRVADAQQSPMVYNIMDSTQGQNTVVSSDYEYKIGRIPSNFIHYSFGNLLAKGSFISNAVGKNSTTGKLAVYDSGVLNDFNNWTSENLGNGTSTKLIRRASVATGAAGTARIYTVVPVNGTFWDNSSADIDLSFSFYTDEEWAAATTDGRVYFKFGGNADPHRTGTTGTEFGFELSGLNSSSKISLTAFTRQTATTNSQIIYSAASTVASEAGFDVTEKHLLRMVARELTNNVEFYVDDVLKTTLDLTLTGTTANPYITVAAANGGSAGGSQSGITLNQISYVFKY